MPLAVKPGQHGSGLSFCMTEIVSVRTEAKKCPYGKRRKRVHKKMANGSSTS